MNDQYMDSLIQDLLSQPWACLLEQPARAFSALKNPHYPGVYVIGYSDRNLAGQAIALNEIFYIGMSNSDGGVQERIKSFINGIEKNKKHSGGRRFYASYAGGQPFSVFSQINGAKQFFVTAVTIPCEVTKAKRTAEDLRKMGEVARLEYYLLAYYKSILGNEPELNKK